MASVAFTTSGSGNSRKLDSIANEITVPVDVKLKRKSEQEKKMGRRVINSQLVTLNETAQSLQLRVAIGTKNSLV